jgi:PleD family two-component response regulator
MNAVSDRAAAGQAAPGGAAFRVLVVDDDPDMAAYLARLLAAEGMLPLTVGDGESALAKAVTESTSCCRAWTASPSASG